MPEDHEQIVVRRKKLQALRERGIDPYPNDFRPDHTTAEVHARLSALGEAELARAAPLSVAARVDLEPPGPVLNLQEARLAEVAQRHDPSRDRQDRKSTR